MDKLALANASAEAMWREDHACKELGIEIHEVRPGYARLGMPVTPQMVNGHRLCHGGFIFTLADSAFAYASNSHGQRSVAAAAAIEFLAPAYKGDVLSAEGLEQALAGRHGIYDVRVTNQRGETIALFRGRSASIKGTLA